MSDRIHVDISNMFSTDLPWSNWQGQIYPNPRIKYIPISSPKTTDARKSEGAMLLNTVVMPFNFGDKVYLDHSPFAFSNKYVVCGFEIRKGPCIWVIISPNNTDQTLLVEDYRLTLVPSER